MILLIFHSISGWSIDFLHIWMFCLLHTLSLTSEMRGNYSTLQQVVLQQVVAFSALQPVLFLIMATIPPLTIGKLRPFPLPKELVNLPSTVIEQLSSLYELTQGFVLSLETYHNHEKEVFRAIDDNVNTLNRIIDLLHEYCARADQIAEHVEQMETLYREFLSLETQQYQLLSGNFNTDLLKVRFEKLVQELDQKSLVVARSFQLELSLAGLLRFLQEFKDTRKGYHMRKEKLNRWEEERIGGLF